MSYATVEEVVGVFASAKNLNAALKNFLKREVQGNAAVERLAKEFRAAAASGRTLALASFVGRYYPAQEVFFSAVARHAHPELFDATINGIYAAHAEEFNKTYSQSGESITVTDPAKFASIVQQVDGMIEAGVRGQGMTPNSFLRRAFLMGIFEPAVLKEVVAIRSA
ncbi:MAG: hypothetical protein EBZ48_11190 [Proteobacteria bacterium]|nr:hypothetical protein [Pseudomonadota bacterium]